MSDQGITIDSVMCRADALSNQANQSLSAEGNEMFRQLHTSNIYRVISNYYKIKNNEPGVPRIANPDAKQTYLAKLVSDIDIAIINAEVAFLNFYGVYGVQVDNKIPG